MHYNILLLIFAFIMTIDVCYGQQANSKSVGNIRFEGIEKSDEEYLTQFILSHQSTDPSDSLILSDVQRLKNLSGIAHVDYRKENHDGIEQLVFEIEERRTLLPILNSGGITDNIWFQVGFTDINWLGKGQVLSAAYLNNDGRHSGNVYYKNQRIKQSDWGYTASISSWSSLEPLYFPEATVNYEYGNDGIGLTAIRHLDLHRQFEFGATYFIENYKKSQEQFSDVSVGPDQLKQVKWLTKLQYSENHLNYHYFYLKGIEWNALLQNVYNTDDRSWFHSILLQAKTYARIGARGNLANRFRIGVASNNDSPFAPFVADSHVNIRGIGNRIDRGTAQLILNTEYRQALLENSRWGIQVVSFADAGTWRNPGGQLTDLFDPDQFRIFVGGGIRIIYHRIYGATLRLDYAVDVLNQHQRGFVVGLGQYF